MHACRRAPGRLKALKRAFNTISRPLARRDRRHQLIAPEHFYNKWTQFLMSCEQESEYSSGFLLFFPSDPLTLFGAVTPFSLGALLNQIVNFDTSSSVFEGFMISFLVKSKAFFHASCKSGIALCYCTLNSFTTKQQLSGVCSWSGLLFWILMFQFLFCKGHSYSRRVVAFSVRMLWSRDRGSFLEAYFSCRRKIVAQLI